MIATNRITPSTTASRSGIGLPSVERSGVQRSGVQRSGVQPSGVERSGVKVSGVEVSGEGRSGVGSIALANVAGRTAVVRCRANSPLRLLTPQTASLAARVIVGSYGGGIVGGDAIDLTVDAGENTGCLIGTQASTKVFRSAGPECSQQLRVQAGAGAVVVSLPDPVVCFAEANFLQRQQFNLAPSASLVMLDWFTSGRAARGERWAMRHYASQTEINVEGVCVFRDWLTLHATDGEIGIAMRMGRIDCFATVVFVGPATADHSAALAQAVQREAIGASDSVLVGASRFPFGAVLRVAGRSTETVGAVLSKKLSFVSGLLGMDPWRRKW